jgi:hypothetical protein
LLVNIRKSGVVIASPQFFSPVVEGVVIIPFRDDGGGAHLLAMQWQQILAIFRLCEWMTDSMYHCLVMRQQTTVHGYHLLVWVVGVRLSGGQLIAPCCRVLVLP